MDATTIFGGIVGFLLLRSIDKAGLPTKTINDKLTYFWLWVGSLLLINISVRFLSYISYPILDFIKSLS